MFKLYLNGAMLIPAMNAPTAIENPKYAATVEKIKNVVNAMRRIISLNSAAAPKSLGKTVLDRMSAAANIVIPLKNAVTSDTVVNAAVVDIAESKNITIISCMSNNPMASLPDRVSTSSLSENILTTTEVLLNATINPRIAETELDNPKYIEV